MIDNSGERETGVRKSETAVRYQVGSKITEGKSKDPPGLSKYCLGVRGDKWLRGKENRSK